MTTQLPARPAVILLVEDNASDQYLTRRALDKCPYETRLMVVDDGESALNYLSQRNQYADAGSAPRPDLILLDLNLPDLEGRAVLRAIRDNSALKNIPVVILTTSSRQDDVTLSYSLGANSYVVKPQSIDKYAETITQLLQYWFSVVVLPAGGGM